MTEQQRGDMRIALLERGSPMPLFVLLRPSEQDDILHGRCIYRQYEGVPILDYTAAS